MWYQQLDTDWIDRPNLSTRLLNVVRAYILMKLQSIKIQYMAILVRPFSIQQVEDQDSDPRVKAGVPQALGPDTSNFEIFINLFRYFEQAYRDRRKYY